MVKKKNILVLTYWSYAEALIQTYTLPYVRVMKRQLGQDSIIYLFTLEKDWLAVSREERSRIEKNLLSEGIVWRSIRYSPFGIKAVFKWCYAFIYLTFLIFRKHVWAIHCWATPAGAAGFFLSLFTGRKLILDSYEPHAEAMLENGTWTKTGLPFRLLFWLEKKQTQRANFIISTTEGMKDYAKRKYGVDIKFFYVKPACVDLSLFSAKNLKNGALQDALGLRKKIVCVYAGKLGGIYLEKEVFEFIRIATDHWGEEFRFLLLSSHNRKFVDDLCMEAGVEPSRVILKFVPHAEIPNYMGLADFAITPVKPVPSKRYCTPIKDGEYWALGLPVVIPDHISDDSDIIRKYNAGAVLNHLQVADYKNAVEMIDGLLREPRVDNFNKIRALAVQYRNFDIAERIYKAVYTE